jgi:hypothetical protein
MASEIPCRFNQKRGLTICTKRDTSIINDDAVFQVAAPFPMEKMRTGVVRQGPPFDVEEFVKRIGVQT